MLCHASDPFPGVSNATQLFDMIKSEKRRPEIPADTCDVLRNIMTQCWQLEPQARPQMEDIVNMILEDEKG